MVDRIGAGEDVAGEEEKEEAVVEEEEVEPQPSIRQPLASDQCEAHWVPHQLLPSILCHHHHRVVLHQQATTPGVWNPITYRISFSSWRFGVVLISSIPKFSEDLHKHYISKQTGLPPCQNRACHMEFIEAPSSS